MTKNLNFWKLTTALNVLVVRLGLMICVLPVYSIEYLFHLFSIRAYVFPESVFYFIQTDIID